MKFYMVISYPLFHILRGLSGSLETNYDIITNICDDGYDFYIAHILTEYCRANLYKEEVLGEEFAKYLKLQAICIKQKIFHAHDYKSFIISPRLFRSIYYNNLFE